MTTQQAVAKAMSVCRDRLGHVGRNEFLLAMSSTEIALLIAAKFSSRAGSNRPANPAREAADKRNSTSLKQKIINRKGK